MTRTLLAPLLPICVVASTLGACRTVQPEPEPIYIPPPVAKTCFEREELVVVTIPEETKTFYATVLIDNPPYEPIAQTTPQTRVVRPAYTVLQDSSGNVVTEDKICDDDLVTQPIFN